MPCWRAKHHGHSKRPSIRKNIPSITNVSIIRWISPWLRRRCGTVSTRNAAISRTISNWSSTIVNTTMKMIVPSDKLDTIYEHSFKLNGQNNSPRSIQRIHLSSFSLPTMRNREEAWRLSEIKPILCLVLMLQMKNFSWQMLLFSSWSYLLIAMLSTTSCLFVFGWYSIFFSMIIVYTVRSSLSVCVLFIQETKIYTTCEWRNKETLDRVR